VSAPDAEAVAKRLGLTEAVIRRLRAHGKLQRLSLDDRDVRERLYAAHVAFVLRNARRA
jgi:hypothetical protein